MTAEHKRASPARMCLTERTSGTRSRTGASARRPPRVPDGSSGEVEGIPRGRPSHCASRERLCHSRRWGNGKPSRRLRHRRAPPRRRAGQIQPAALRFWKWIERGVALAPASKMSAVATGHLRCRFRECHLRMRLIRAAADTAALPRGRNAARRPQSRRRRSRPRSLRPGKGPQV